MAASPFDRKLLAPRHWPTWALVGLLWCLAKLPWGVQRRLGAGLGWLAYHLVQPRVADTRINLRLCFPEKSDAEREAMVRDVFRNAGIGVFETLNAWFRDASYYRDKTTFEGVEHYRAATAAGRGVLLVGAHYSTLDLLTALTSPYVKADMIYRPQKNPVINHVMTRARSGHQGDIISYRDIRRLVRAFKDNHHVWYPLDQDYGAAHAVFVPFFGVPAATLTTASRLAKINNAPLLFLNVVRQGDAEQYHVLFTPALENFPGPSEQDDTARINAELEKLIRRAPTQYMWFHRRFKNRPNGEKPPYAPKRKELRWLREEAARREEDAL